MLSGFLVSLFLIPAIRRTIHLSIFGTDLFVLGFVSSVLASLVILTILLILITCYYGSMSIIVVDKADEIEEFNNSNMMIV
jgi:hypothetical protein